MYDKIKVFNKEDLLKVMEENYNMNDCTFGLPDDVIGHVFYGRFTECGDFKYYAVTKDNFTFSVPADACVVLEKNVMICKVCKHSTKFTCNKYTDCRDCEMCDDREQCKCTYSYDRYNNTCLSFEEVLPDGE